MCVEDETEGSFVVLLSNGNIFCPTDLFPQPSLFQSNENNVFVVIPGYIRSLVSSSQTKITFSW